MTGRVSSRTLLSAALASIDLGYVREREGLPDEAARQKLAEVLRSAESSVDSERR